MNMAIPIHVKQHLEALGVGEAGIESVEREMAKALVMTRAELKQAIEVKNDAIKYLRVQQAVYLSALEAKQ